jgi:hypothetical protein
MVEFDLPGHSKSWVAGYPEVVTACPVCTSTPSTPAIYPWITVANPGVDGELNRGVNGKRWGQVGTACTAQKGSTLPLNVARNATFKLMESLLHEMTGGTASTAGSAQGLFPVSQSVT